MFVIFSAGEGSLHDKRDVTQVFDQSSRLRFYMMNATPCHIGFYRETDR